MIIDSKYIKDRVREESAKAANEHKDIQNLSVYLKAVQARLYHFLKTLEEGGKSPIKIQTFQDLTSFCDHIDEWFPALLKDHPEIKGVVPMIREMRCRIGNAVIEKIYKEKQAYAEPVANQRLANERDLAKEVFSLIPFIKAEGAEVFVTPEWIHLNHPAVYDRITRYIQDPVTQVLDWGKVRKLLPEALREKCNLVRKLEDPDHEFLGRIRHYRKISEALGPEFLADFLVAQDPSIAKDFEYALKIISRYLGRTTRREFVPDDFKDLPPVAFSKPDLRKVVFLNLRNYIYRRVAQDDQPIAKPGKLLHQIEKELKSKLDVSQKEHQKFLEEVIEYFSHVLSIQVPSRLQEQIKEPDGRVISVPTLRQRIAMHEIKEGGRKLIAFFMGKGKTATSFLAKEYVGAKKMLYICPSGSGLPKTVASQISKHYKPDNCPTIGIIEPGMTQEDVDRVKQNEVIIMPYSMLTSKERDDGKITDQLCSITDLKGKAANIDFVAVDEVQWAKNETGRYTEEVRRFVTNIPNLRHVALLSGDPTPNSPNDILPQLRIKSPHEFGDAVAPGPKGAESQSVSPSADAGNLKMRSLRFWMKQHDPLLLRSMLLDFILKLDPPEDWQQYVISEKVELSPAQRTQYELILNNEDLTAGEKIHQLMLAILNPDLLCPAAPEDAILDKCVEIVRQDFEKYDSVVIGEDRWKQGLMRPYEEYPNVPTFVHKLRSRLEKEYGAGKVEVLVIDGETPERDREAYLKKARYPEGGKKVVLVAMISIICEGINLSSIHRAILLEPTLRLADTAQFTKRFAREGNTDVKIRKLIVPNTIFQGIEEHALHKFMLCQRLLEGGTLTDDDLAFLEHDDFSGATEFRDGRLVIGTAISNAALNTRQTLSAYYRYLHNKGELELSHFIELHGENYAEKFVENWEGTYSANNARFVAGLVGILKKEGLLSGNHYADVACGPLAFENTYGLADEDAKITNFDLNPYILEEGVELLRRRKHDPNYQPTKHVCGMTKLQARDGAFDVVNCASALHYLHQRGSKNVYNHERASALVELNRVLRDDGLLLITLPPHVCQDDQFEAFMKELSNFGFKVVSKYSGSGRSVDQENGNEFRNRILVCQKTGPVRMERVDVKNLAFSRGSVPSGKGGDHKKVDTIHLSHHTEFVINKAKVSYDVKNGEKEAKENDLRYQKMVQKARGLLLRIYEENGQSLDELSHENQQALREEGITLLRLSGVRGDGKWMFSLSEQTLKTGLSHYVFEDEVD